MPNNIKPSEVSDVLLRQLENIDTNIKFEEVGIVLSIGDGVARIYGLTGVTENELIEFDNGVMAVAMNLEEDNVGAVLLGSSEGIKEGQSVKRTGRVASIEVSESMLGRVINPLGQPLDGGGAIDGEKFLMPLDRKAPGVIYRQPVNQALQTGLKAVDSMIPIGRGQRELIIGDRQTGKTAIAIDTIIKKRKLRKRRSRLLHLRGHRPESFNGGQHRQHAEGKRGNALHHCCLCNGRRTCCVAVFRTICRCGHRRILPRPWLACPCRLR